MKLAQVMAGAPQGGAELFFERLTLALHDAGDDVLAAVRRDPQRAARLKAGGVVPLELGFGGVFDLLTGPRLKRALRDFSPTVTVAWMNRAARFTPAGPWTLVGRLGGYYDLKYYRRCDHLVGNTHDLVRYIVAQGWPADRAHYLPNFAPDLVGAAPAALPGQRRLLALGRLHRNKGFDVLIRALASVPAAHLSLAGEGPERDALTRLAAECGVADRVTFLGWRQDTGALLAGADLLVVPSRHEPLGNVVLEGFSAGRPVIAAAAAGPRELIEDGRNGILVPLEDPGALAVAIAALLAESDRASALAAAGRQTFAQNFAEAPVVAAWRAFLAQVAP
ncbi:glycosyltransferase [Humitalea sp. 24SJ18S-53]|uniref:glycosyltransferase n=1 Tax=Humitalea sp. 24SJ18S-53 TaxID=3422307 RepID=UPI003D677673